MRTPTVVLRHNRVALALHHQRDAVDDDVRALLVLHGLGEHRRSGRRRGQTGGRARSGAST